MPIIDLIIWLNEGHCWQSIMLHVLRKLLEVLDVIPERRGHNRGDILERVTNATEGGIGPSIKALTVILPRDMVCGQGISNSRKRLRRDHERCASGKLTGRCIARQVVVEQVIGSWRTITVAERLIGQGV